MCNIQQQSKQSKVCYSMNRSFSCTEYFAKEKASKYLLHSLMHQLCALFNLRLRKHCMNVWAITFPFFRSLRQFSSLRFQPWLVFTFLCAVSFSCFCCLFSSRTFLTGFIMHEAFYDVFFTNFTGRRRHGEVWNWD